MNPGSLNFGAYDNTNSKWIFVADHDGTNIFNGNSKTTDKLLTARTIAISGGATGTATSFNGSADITIPVTDLDMDKASAGTLAVARGGTGSSTLDGAGIVTKSGSQTIAGAKTFTSSINIQRANPYLFFIETDQERGQSSGNNYQGIYFRDKNSADLGKLVLLNYGTSCGLRLYAISTGASAGDWNDNYIEIGGGSAGGVKYIAPFATKTFSLGDSNHLFTELFCNSQTINTSDEKEKAGIAGIPDDVLDAWGDVSFFSFRFNDALAKKGDSARLHSGLVAQRIESVFRAHGLDGFRWGLLCRDQGEAVDRIERNADGEPTVFHEDAFDNWGVRYTEALCMEAAYQRRRADRAEARIASLEERFADLERRVASNLPA